MERYSDKKFGLRLVSDGTEDETFVQLSDAVIIKTVRIGQLSNNDWSKEQIRDLLDDGMRFRLLKKAEIIKRDMLKMMND